MQTGWAVGDNGTILKTTDGGNTWGLQTSGTTESLQSVHFINTQTGYIVGTNGVILKTVTGGGSTFFPPSLASPSDNAAEVSINPRLNWNNCIGATSYHLQVATDRDFWVIVENQGSIVGTSYAVTGLANSTTYYWRVNATYANGTSNWSDVWSFTTISLPLVAPVLSSPPNRATNQSITLSLNWYLVQRATSYLLQTAKDSGFGNIVLADSSITAAVKQIGHLEINTKYYWHAKARNNLVLRTCLALARGQLFGVSQ